MAKIFNGEWAYEYRVDKSVSRRVGKRVSDRSDVKMDPDQTWEILREEEKRYHKTREGNSQQGVEFRERTEKDGCAI